MKQDSHSSPIFDSRIPRKLVRAKKTQPYPSSPAAVFTRVTSVYNPIARGYGEIDSGLKIDLDILCDLLDVSH
jgi:hypothetical protein